jgi:hypothetical protein
MPWRIVYETVRWKQQAASDTYCVTTDDYLAEYISSVPITAQSLCRAVVDGVDSQA